MNIAIITSPFGVLPPNGIGAVEKCWYYMAYSFCKRGDNVIFYAKKDDVTISDQFGFDCRFVKGYNRTGILLGDLMKDLIFSLKSLFFLKSCDILILNTFWSPILSPLFKVKFKRSVYNVARYPKGQFKFYKYVDQLSCVSSSVTRALQTEIGADNRIVMVNNPINLDYFTYVPELNNGNISVMYHGRIHPEKGLDLLFAACNILYKKYPFLSLKVVGPIEVSKGGGGDSYLRQLKQMAGDIPVEWKSAISDPQEIALELASCNIYCYPSIASKGETFGVSPLEAMGVGRTVVVSQLECFEDFIENGVNGFVFDHKSQDSILILISILEKLILSPSLRKQIGYEAYKTSLKFSVEKIADNYRNNFLKLLNNG